MEFAEDSIEVDFARLLGSIRKGLAQRRCDAEPVVGNVETNFVTVAQRRRMVGQGSFKIHDNTTNDGARSFVTGRIRS